MRGERSKLTPGMKTPWTPVGNGNAGSAGARRKMPENAGKQSLGNTGRLSQQKGLKSACLARETPQKSQKIADAQADDGRALNQVW